MEGKYLKINEDEWEVIYNNHKYKILRFCVKSNQTNFQYFLLNLGMIKLIVYDDIIDKQIKENFAFWVMDNEMTQDIEKIRRLNKIKKLKQL